VKTFVGVDFHKTYSYGTIVNESGQILKQGKFPSTLGAVNRFLAEYGGPQCTAVVEACRNWELMHDWLEQCVGEVKLAHSKKVRVIAEAKIKTDKIDATVLAQLLRVGMMPTAHVSSPRARILKRALRHRMFLVRVRTMVKNRIHALLDRYPEVRAERPRHGLFTGLGIAWLKQAGLPKESRRVLDGEVRLLEHLNEQIARADKHLTRLGQADARVQRVQTVPGIGRFLATLIVSEIDDLGRFAHAKKLHAYAGLVPSTYSSGGRTYHGKIIKAGNPYLRWAMVEAVWPAIHKDVSLHQMYHRLAARKGANKAKVAVARRLLTIVYRVLAEQRDYRPLPEQETTFGGPGIHLAAPSGVRASS